MNGVTEHPVEEAGQLFLGLLDPVPRSAHTDDAVHQAGIGGRGGEEQHGGGQYRGGGGSSVPAHVRRVPPVQSVHPVHGAILVLVRPGIAYSSNDASMKRRSAQSPPSRRHSTRT